MQIVVLIPNDLPTLFLNTLPTCHRIYSASKICDMSEATTVIRCIVSGQTARTTGGSLIWRSKIIRRLGTSACEFPRRRTSRPKVQLCREEGQRHDRNSKT